MLKVIIYLLVLIFLSKIPFWKFGENQSLKLFNFINEEQLKCIFISSARGWGATENKKLLRWFLFEKSSTKSTRLFSFPLLIVAIFCPNF